MILHRRAFFSFFEKDENQKAKDLGEASNKGTQTKPLQNSRIEIGRFSSFPVNTTTEVNNTNPRVKIISSYQGLQAWDQLENKYFKLGLTSNGTIEIDLSTFWDANSVLSAMTGELYKI